MNRTLYLAFLIFALNSSHVHAQDQIQPTPEADSGPPYVVTPAPFATTVWRAGARGELRLSGALAGYRGPLVARDFAGKTVWTGRGRLEVKAFRLGSRNWGFTVCKRARRRFHLVSCPRPNQRRSKSPGAPSSASARISGRAPYPKHRFAFWAKLASMPCATKWRGAPSEKEKGVYLFKENFFTYNRLLKKYGIPLHYSASYGNPLYPRGSALSRRCRRAALCRCRRRGIEAVRRQYHRGRGFERTQQIAAGQGLRTDFRSNGENGARGGFLAADCRRWWRRAGRRRHDSGLCARGFPDRRSQRRLFAASLYGAVSARHRLLARQRPG